MSDGWHDDPLGRYPKRYYDGSQWTHHVTDGSGQTLQDPLGTQPTPGGAPPTAPSVSASEMSAAGGVAGFRALPGNPFMRFIAALIDGLLIGVPLFFLMDALGIGGFDFDFSAAADGEDVEFDYPVSAQLIQAAVFVAYATYMVGTFGRTVGKMACGLTVVTRGDASRPSYGVAFVRAVAWAIYNIPVIGWILFIISVVMAFSGSLRQTLHDKIASTVVAKSSSL